MEEQGLVASWKRFWHDVPGRRFVRRHERLSRHRDGLVARLLRGALGILLVVLGLIFGPLPGPGWVPMLAGLAVLAGLSLRIASWLDRAEVRARRWLGRDRKL